MFKKLTVVCGLLLAATAAVAELPWPWMPLDSTPFPVGEGSHITYGDDRIWGKFPTEDSSKTFVWYYSPLPDTGDTADPNVGEWCSLPGNNSRWFGWTLAYTGMTYQWDKALYVIGADTGDGEDTPDGYLDRYITDLDTWIIYDIDEDTEFVLGEGACIAYAPNLDYDSTNQVEGYIYCLPGGGSEFWRYSIEPETYTTGAGIFPPNISVIADQTPLFQWIPSSGGQYRLQVSTDDLFSNIVIDEVLFFAPEYQTTTKLANVTYYWHVGTPNGGGWLYGATHSFTEEGGFDKLTNIPEGVAKGAAMAYSGNLWQGGPSIIVLNGYVDDGEARYFHRWSINGKQWSELSSTDPAPMDEMAGTSLTTGDPVTGQSGWYVAAAFGNSSTVDRPYGYQPSLGDAHRWWEYDSLAFDPFPQHLGPGATFVMGPSPWCYLTTGAPYVGGDPTKYFYAIDPERKKRKKDNGGSQAGGVLAGNRRAQAIASNNGIEVEYQLPAGARVRATLHDAVGRQVGLLDCGLQESGTHRLGWKQGCGGREFASGAYFVLLDMGVEKATLKAVIR